jgi:cell division topological specificity factor
MRFVDLFLRRGSAKVAQQRLQILLMHERTAGNQSDLIPILREEVIAVIGKHVNVDPNKVQVKLERGDVFSLLEIDIEVPTPLNRNASSLGSDKRPSRALVRANH